MAAPAASSIIIRRCEASATDAALGLIGFYWPDSAPVTRAANLEAVVITAADQTGEFYGAVVGQVLPGNVASVSPPRTRSLDQAGELARRLLKQLDVELRAASVELAQTLLEPEDAAAAAMLRGGGYEHASDLLYMAAEAGSFPEQAFPLPFELVPLSSDDEARLVRLVDATYVGTLDCPRIDGLRATADVLAGYRAVGESGARLWRVVRAENADVGCLLLADHSSTRQHEVVYVGLTPEVRGRGWGLELTRHAQWLARQAACERLVLAVDAANEPAIRIYASAGFRAWDRRAVWIKSFGAGPTG